MPDVPIRRFLMRHGWLVAIAAAYLYIFPYYPKLKSANELPRIYLVKAIVEDHTFAIDHGVKVWGATSDLAAHGGHFYPNKAPGASFVVVPFYACLSWAFGEPSLGETMWLCRIVTGVIPSLVFLWLLYGFLARYAPEPEVRQLVLIAYALGSLAMTYSLLYYSHQLSAVCVGSAWILGLDVADRKRSRIALAVTGLLIGLAVIVDYQASFAVQAIAVHVVVRMRRASWRWGEIGTGLAIATIATAIPIALLLYYHAVCFGSPFATGYNFAVTYGSDHDHGLLGMTTPTWTAFVGTMVAPDNGFITLAPWWLLAIPGGIVLWRSERGTVITAGVIALFFIYFITSIGFWRAGWEVGPRYIAAMQPFLLPLVAAAVAKLRTRPLAIGAACGAIVAGVIVYSVTSATLPYWPDAIKNPLYDVAFRLLHDGAVAPNLAGVLGLHGILGIAPFLIGIAVLVGWAIVRVSNRRGLVIAVVFGVAVIVALGLAPHNPGVTRPAYANTLYPAVAQ